MYSIHEVCERTGLSAHTLRYYEKEKLLPNVGRSPGGFRQYSDEDLVKVPISDAKTEFQGALVSLRDSYKRKAVEEFFSTIQPIY